MIDLFLTSSRDGHVMIWDLRDPGQCESNQGNYSHEKSSQYSIYICYLSRSFFIMISQCYWPMSGLEKCASKSVFNTAASKASEISS
jgi:hypothetical protein